METYQYVDGPFGMRLWEHAAAGKSQWVELESGGSVQVRILQMLLGGSYFLAIVDGDEQVPRLVPGGAKVVLT
jgi:hypothetical protein